MILFGELNKHQSKRFAKIKHAWYPGDFYLSLDDKGFEDVGDLQSFVEKRGGVIHIAMFQVAVRLSLDECDIELYERNN